MRGRGKHGASTIRWFFQDATTFTIIFLIILITIALDPLGASIDTDLCESNTTDVQCNTGQLHATSNTLRFTITNEADNDIILQSMTINDVNDIPLNHTCHTNDEIIRSAHTHPIDCSEVNLATNTINEITMTYTYYQSGRANADTIQGEITIFTEPQ
jgi:hypothetical protein